MKWDVFISHASEDKDSFVRQLATELQNKGVKVFYDEFSLKLGDSLSASIDKGLSESRFGIVVLSKHFFNKNWTTRELAGLVTRETSGEGKIILPLWHGVTQDEVRKFSPPLADIIALDTSQGIEQVINKILEIVQIKTEGVEQDAQVLRRALESKDVDIEQLRGEVKALDRMINKLIERAMVTPNITGNYYENSGQVVAMGDYAHAHDMTFNQTVNNSGDSLDLVALAAELAQLRMAIMAKQDTSIQASKAIGVLADAEEAAKANDQSKVMKYLKAAGEWTLNFAKEIGKDLTVEAIKISMGM